jgi:hypothetical protein
MRDALRRGRLQRIAQRACVVVVACLTGACELQEVTLADSRDLVVAEVVLRARVLPQHAWLHRTFATGSLAVPGALVEVTNDAGHTLTYEPAAATACLDIEGADTTAARLGSCYRAEPPSSFVPPQPGEHYRLRITLADGGVLTGETTMPQPLELLRPPTPDCYLEPDTTLEFVWRPTSGAWVYIAETELVGIGAALRARGVEFSGDRIRLLGLSIGREDTTIVFPTEFGLFDRGDPEVADALVAIQSGLPPGVVAHVHIAAADRNYVNWVRGGQFNPSGAINVASIQGDGTGVFGSIVPVQRNVETHARDGLAACR